MTGDKKLRENYFRAIVTNGPCGLSTADNTVRQAAKRLDIIAGTPIETPSVTSPTDGYPFPHVSRLYPAPAKSPSDRSRRSSEGRSKHRKESSALTIPPSPRHRSSSASLRSIDESPGIMPMPAINSSSSVSRGTGHGYSSSAHEDSPISRPSALENLRQVSDRSMQMQATHRRNESNASMLSHFSPTPAPAVLSVATTSNEVVPAQAVGVLDGQPSATESLRQARASSSGDLESVSENVQWPSLTGWTMAKSPPLSPAEIVTPPALEITATSDGPETPVPVSHRAEKSSSVFRSVASSPNISGQTHLSPRHAHTRSVNAPRSKPSSASLLGGNAEIAQIDPTLAAAELASALTKHVCCSVCAVKGVNFPECRKCGMRFCSRDCRVGQKGAGDGKKHLCGAWESRKRSAKMQAVTEGLEVGLEKAGVASMGESLGRTPTPAGVRAF